MKKIAENLYTFTGLKFGRVYLTIDADGLTLIDAGLGSAPPQIIKQLEAAGYTASDVKRILITHAHPDHVGGLPEMKRLTGAEIYASAGEALVIEKKQQILRGGGELGDFVGEGVAVENSLLQDGDLLKEVFGGLQVIGTPGHSPDHIAFWQPETRTLFAGDAVWTLLGMRLPPARFTADVEENKNAVKKLAALEPTLLCAGHGVPLTKDAADKLKRFAANRC